MGEHLRQRREEAWRIHREELEKKNPDAVKMQDRSMC